MKNKTVYMRRDDGYWACFDSLEDAVDGCPGEAIYIAEPKYYGKFELKVSAIAEKVKKKK